jgi:hypothetical protein
VAFSPDGSTIVSGSWDNSIKIWDLSSSSLLSSLAGHLREITSVAFSPDGSKIVSGSVDNSIKIWDAPRLIRQAERLSTLTPFPTLVPDLAHGLREQLFAMKGKALEWPLSTSILPERKFTPSYDPGSALAQLASPQLTPQAASLIRMQMLLETRNWRAAKVILSQMESVSLAPGNLPKETLEARRNFTGMVFQALLNQLLTGQENQPMKLAPDLTREFLNRVNRESIAAPLNSPAIAEILVTGCTKPTALPEEFFTATVEKVTQNASRYWLERVASRMTAADQPAETIKRMQMFQDAVGRNAPPK